MKGEKVGKTAMKHATAAPVSAIAAIAGMAEPK
eukprot:CAMPEP_0115090158 /NCGR_PEP_ID=MMETSP0227-20121206/25226_1 /TAXON_ID=89957 /ORGANISM="Polarella glacialis, Strain CCMP 1383" /LENGTH=32 /DNA_ID= /DNA_START= /DNA_END= /DNA_ORIENTATION=